ncbi:MULTISPECIES: hypothetical protein [Pseudoalteromonas]|uniref:hypothetical protein n=1 Tax=Pseudoalteromonas TaxID=53246 RepID=UPI000C344F05|nr:MULTISPECIES: hypothetical protein [Pseudoalteromonas]PKG63650.1 hypothetical protein CXF75_13665 [Pseudoalteromonas arctica]PKG69981.1 hypothetical protein CXF64_12485 [Pseudoalteromonas sp. GutCa3]
MSEVSTPIVYLLSDFASLFEVAVGLNLVFAVWDGLRNQAVERFREISNDVDKALELNLGKDYRTGRCASKYSSLQSSYLSTLEGISKYAKVLGLLVTALLLGVLAYIGYSPLEKVTFIPITILVVISTLVTPLFLVSGHLFVIRGKKKLLEFQQHQNNAFTDLQQFSNEVIKRNDV